MNELLTQAIENSKAISGELNDLIARIDVFAEGVSVND